MNTGLEPESNLQEQIDVLVKNSYDDTIKTKTNEEQI